MRLRVCLFVAAVVLSPALVSAQTVHPCDQPPQTEPTKGNRVGWCHDRKDADALLYQQGQLGFKLYVDGQVFDLGTSLVPIGAPSATGQYFFEAPMPSAPGRGEYAVTVSAYSLEGESPAATPVVWQVGGPPSTPKNPRVK